MTSDMRGVALDASSQRGVGRVAGAAPLDVGHEVGEHDLLDARLAERRQDALDVAEEHAVRADHEHALVLEREAMGVEQVGGAVQGDDGLAGAGAALDDEHAGLRRADDLVLLGLDRGDDVAERAGAAALERGEQRRVAAQRRTGVGIVAVGHQPVVVADAEVPAAEQLVLEAEHASVPRRRSGAGAARPIGSRPVAR